MTEKNIAVVLAAGQGRRMQSTVQKQYLLLGGKPVLYYSKLNIAAGKLYESMVSER